MLSCRRVSPRTAFVVSLAAFGASAHAIVGGTIDAPNSVYQYMGAFTRSNNDVFSGTPIAPNWFVTAAHNLPQIGTTYTNPDGTFTITNVVNVPNSTNDPNGLVGTTDLALVQVGGAFTHYYSYGGVPTSPAAGVNGTTATLVGIGGYSSAVGSAPGGSVGRAYATNTVDQLSAVSMDNTNFYASYVYDLDDGTSTHNVTGSQLGTLNEGGLADHDSGGGWFVNTGSSLPMLIAVSSGVGSQPGSNYYNAGAVGFGVDLAYYSSFLSQTTGVGPYVAPVPEPAPLAALGIGALAILRRKRR